MPDGKPAGVRCIQLSDEGRCLLFGQPDRPDVCSSLSPSPEMCGKDSQQAIDFLTRLEQQTAI